MSSYCNGQTGASVQWDCFEKNLAGNSAHLATSDKNSGFTSFDGEMKC